MDNFNLNTPVALIIFNRPDTTAQVFAEIAKAKPPKLLVIADGPRDNRPNETVTCEKVRDIIDSTYWCAVPLRVYGR